LEDSYFYAGNIERSGRTKEFRAVLFTFENYKAYNAYCEKYRDEKGERIKF